VVHFTAERAVTYLCALGVWIGVWIVVIAEHGGRMRVTDVTGTVQLVAMFIACSVISAMAFKAALDAMPPSADLVRFAVTWTILCWGFLIGAGVPSAVRAIRAQPPDSN
jgi:hypothetical protein